MDEILYVKIEQNIPVRKRALTYKDIASLYCQNKKIVQDLEKQIFYTLPTDCNQKTIFTISKVYEGIYKVYPDITIENLGEEDFVVDLELPDGREKKKWQEFLKTGFISLISFFGAAFTIMTFNEDVSVGDVFDKIYQLITGVQKDGGSILEVCYAIGMPVGVLVFYNHFRRKKIKNDPTPIQVEMHNYEEQVNKALIAAASREGHTIDVN